MKHLVGCLVGHYAYCINLSSTLNEKSNIKESRTAMSISTLSSAAAA